MNWFEDLPDGCPPGDALAAEDDVVYRLTKNNPPVSEDFISQRKEFPEAVFPKIPECIARAVSTWRSPEKCLQQKKFPRHKSKVIAKVKLVSTDGMIKQTFKKNHVSWWRTDSFTLDSVIVLDES